MKKNYPPKGEFYMYPQYDEEDNLVGFTINYEGEEAFGKKSKNYSNWRNIIVMVQYIDKDALVAEIENLLDKGRYHEQYDCAYRDGNNGALYALKGKLDTLEVKEVDLDYIKDELDEVVKIHKPNGDFGWGTLYNVATHFFELGLKAQKGE